MRSIRLSKRNRFVGAKKTQNYDIKVRKREIVSMGWKQGEGGDKHNDVASVSVRRNVHYRGSFSFVYTRSQINVAN